MSFRLTREQLYDLVWSEPMKRLSEQIGISDVAIAKHCRKVGIPVPKRGYWNKLHAGQQVKREELSPRDLGTTNLIEMSGTLDEVLLAHIIGEPGVDHSAESVEVLAERFRKRLGTVKVPSGFEPCHPVIAKLIAKDDELRQKYASQPFPWNLPRYGSPFERRRLKILNGLFLGFSKVGGSASMRGDNCRELFVNVGQSGVSFDLEPARRITSSQDRDTLKANEKLRLTVKSQTPLPSGVCGIWEDCEGAPLEKQITDLIVGLAVAGQHLHRIWEEQMAAWRRQRQEAAEQAERERQVEEQRLERERLAAIEKVRVDALLQDAKNWCDAANIRAYVAAVRSMSGKPTAIAWAQWALEEADRLDPIASGRALTSSPLE